MYVTTYIRDTLGNRAKCGKKQKTQKKKKGKGKIYFAHSILRTVFDNGRIAARRILTGGRLVKGLD